MVQVTVEQARDALNNMTNNISKEDIAKVINKQREIEEKFKGNGPLGKFIKDLKLLFAIIQDYISGEYREIPWLSIAAIAAALLYVLSPIDLIPDFIPIIGYVDDSLVMALCLSMVESDLEQYKAWKIEHEMKKLC